jgi:hypothetical protein
LREIETLSILALPTLDLSKKVLNVIKTYGAGSPYAVRRSNGAKLAMVVTVECAKNKFLARLIFERDSIIWNQPARRCSDADQSTSVFGSAFIEAA